MLLLRVLLYTLTCCIALPALAIHPQTSSLLDTLDYYLEYRETYRQAKCAAIRAKYKNVELTADDCQRLALYQNIIQDYVHVEADSAFVWADRALLLCKRCNDVSSEAIFKALRCSAQTHCGEVYLATVMYEEINPALIADDDKALFYEIGLNVYSRAFSFLNTRQLAEMFIPKFDACLDSLNSCNADTINRRYYTDINELHDEKTGPEAVADLIDMLSDCPRGTYRHGQMALQIARYYAKAKQFDLAEYYFAIAALNNLYGGFNETAALLELGEYLHRRGNPLRANKYLKASLEQAIMFGDNAAAMHISQSLNTVLDDLSDDARSKQRQCNIFIALVTILIIALLALVVYFFRKRRLYHSSNRNLAVRHTTKDYCIRQLLTLCATQITAFEEYNRLVSRKIKGSQVKDLLRIAEDGVALDEQLYTFHRNFDELFLSMCPNFVKRVNLLLSDDKKIVAPSSGALNTEQRFLALIHLGLEDYQHIATLLGISQNSVYTYKNKLKSRAVDRANFEENLRKLD
jgi:hypothetical protein